MSVPTVVILDCNAQRDSQRSVYAGMSARLKQAGIEFVIDDHWNDAYARADLLIGADPLPDSEVLLDCRILGQRTLNRKTRLDLASRFGAQVVPYGAPRTDGELDMLVQQWGTDRAVLKYDWSARRNGVFLWQLAAAQRKPFPEDFDPSCDVFMAFHDEDPRTYKVEACGGVVVGGYLLLTRDMREASWQKLDQEQAIPFDPPGELRRQLAVVSKALLAEGAGYSSFDLMRSGDEFRIVEVNTSGVGTSYWGAWPEQYAESYSRAIVETLTNIETIPRYAELRERALLYKNDAQAPALPHRASPKRPRSAAEPATDTTPSWSAEAAFLDSLKETERMRGRDLLDLVRGPAEALLRQARDQVPFYAHRLDAVLRPDGTFNHAAWPKLPLLHRRDLAENRRELLARRLPPIHGAVGQASTSGTEHAPIAVSRTGFFLGVASCIDVRFFAWHGVGPTDPMATIRRKQARLEAERQKWLPYWFPGPKGPEWELSSTVPVREQLKWLRDRGTVWLRTRPSLAQQMALAVREDASLKPSLLGILTGGEILTDDQRRLIRETLGHAPRDLYGLAEAGTVAIQCPMSSAYHVQSETVRVELLDRYDRPCDRDAIGRIVVTALFSAAMPVIRYDTGDVAVAGENFDFLRGSLCVCGRRLPRLQKILGRHRNQLDIPELGGYPPALDSAHLHDETGAMLWQLVQTGKQDLELRLGGVQSLSAGQSKAAIEHVASRLGGDFQIRVGPADLMTQSGEKQFEPFIAVGTA